MDRTGPVGAGDPLFVYGTLMFDEVLRALLGRTPARQHAHAYSCRRWALRGRRYPALTIGEAAESALPVAGYLIADLSRGEWGTIDRYEDDHYELARIQTDGGPAWAYCYGGARQADLEGEWSPSEFEARYLAEYVRMLGVGR
jgi:gamma-glutamylcyclotransferase (GGCT)/AIG2-like uncharacterized protein YtfP